MPVVTFPNQRMVKIHRERATSDFLGIKNENWQAASRDLGAHALQLYLYLAANANNYTIALSPAAVRQAIGMARSTYHDQFHKLVDKGYIVPTYGNTFEFYEIPQTATQVVAMSSDGTQNFEDNPPSDTLTELHGQIVSAQDTEINNSKQPNKAEINIDVLLEENRYIPKVKEIVIQRPSAEGKERPKPIEHPRKEEFYF